TGADDDRRVARSGGGMRFPLPAARDRAEQGQSVQSSCEAGGGRLRGNREDLSRQSAADVAASNPTRPGGVRRVSPEVECGVSGAFAGVVGNQQSDANESSAG